MPVLHMHVCVTRACLCYTCMSVIHACLCYTCVSVLHMHVCVTHACLCYTCMPVLHMHVCVTHACLCYTCMPVLHMHVCVTHACLCYTCVSVLQLHVTEKEAVEWKEKHLLLEASRDTLQKKYDGLERYLGDLPTSTEHGKRNAEISFACVVLDAMCL